MVGAGEESYLVRQKLLPHHEDLLQLVPPLLRPATHSSPALTQRLKYGCEKQRRFHKHNVSQFKCIACILHTCLYLTVYVILYESHDCEYYIILALCDRE